jgi:serine/threonine protein kinase
MDELIGKTLGPYQITQRLGQGGMATVFQAYQTALQRNVAIKVLPPHLAQDPQFAERFTREARAIARLDHPNILSVYDYGVTEGITYIVMKYVEGGTLKDRLELGRLSFEQTEILLDQVAKALDYAHGMGIVHRDIKPANVLLARPDWALLSDFGLAKVAEATVKLTGTGVGMGTPEYMAPEQAHGLETDARADIYALGVTVYAMVTGQVPYTGSSPIEVILKHVNAPLPSARAINPALPPAAEAAIVKAMSKRPQDRFATAGEFSKAFIQGLHSGAAVSAPRTAPAPPAGATVLEPGPSVVPGATVMDSSPMPSYPPPTPGRGATVLEPGYPSATQPPPAGFTPSQGVTSLPVAPPVARRGGFPWIWVGVAVFAFICVGALGSMGILGSLGVFNIFGGATATPEVGGVIITPTIEPPTPAPAAQVAVQALPEGHSAISLNNIVQPPISDVLSPATQNYTAVVATTDDVDIGPFWCAIDAATLEDNWGKTSYRIEVDGQPVDLGTLRLGSFSDNTCRGYFALANEWTAGGHEIVITRTFTSEVFDGWCTYSPGDYVENFAITAITPSAATTATEQAPPPLAAGQRVVEDFSTDRGLYTYQGACRASQSVTGGVLRQAVSSTFYEVHVGVPGAYNNFEVTVEATFVRVDGAGAEHGVQFRKSDSDNYYAFLVSEDRQFVFGRLHNGDWSDIISWQAANACTGVGAAETLGVVANGSHFEFYCNGQLLGQADDSTFSQGVIALESGTYDATYAETTFDNVSITGR